MWTPLEFKRRFASIYMLVEKDRAIKERRETDWTHRTRFGFYSYHSSFSSKTRCDSFVDLISVEMRVSRNR
jgi:hypothetical protein